MSALADLADDLNEAYGRLQDALKKYTDIKLDLEEAQNGLEASKLAGLVSGAIEGRNAELREASARQLLANDYLQLRCREQDETYAKRDLELARLEVKRVRAILRLAELQVQVATLEK